jgi:AAA family ATP:ADP antiporter
MLSSEHLKKLFSGFSINSLLASILFFLVLSSWYILRPIRNDMAAQNEEILPLLLGFGAFAMIAINPLYSWIASRNNLKGIFNYSYLFFIANLVLFAFFADYFQMNESPWFSRFFYIWCNVFSFFVVSVFWVLVINIFRGESSKAFYGVIAAGGSIGSFLGSGITKSLSDSINTSGITLFSISSVCFLIIALILGNFLIHRSKQEASIMESVGGDSIDAFRNLISNKQIRFIGTYMYLWTGLMTIHWVTSISIINEWSQDSADRIRFFGNIEQTVAILTVFSQFFLTNLAVRFIGIKKIFVLYGLIFTAVYIGYSIHPTISLVFGVTILLRVFEYGYNKPSREILFSQLSRVNRYKATVLVDTALVRLGDFSGSGFIFLGKILAFASSQIPLLAIPFSAALSYVGSKMVSNDKAT